MACEIVQIDKDLQLELISLVKADLTEAEGKVDLDKYIKDTYKKFLDAGLVENFAINYAKYIPASVARVMGKNRIYTKIDSEQLNEFEDMFEDFTQAAEFLSPGITQEKIDVVEAELIKEKNSPAKVVAEPSTEKQLTAKSKKFVDSFKPASALSSTGQQGKPISELTDDQIITSYPEKLTKGANGRYTKKSINEFRKKNGNTASNYKKEYMDFYYNFLTELQKAMSNKETDAEHTEMNGHKGFSLQIMTKADLKEKHLSQDDINFLEGKRDKTKKQAAELFPKTIASFVSDTEGNILYFDENYNVVGEEKGKPIYFNLRSVKTIDKTDQTDLSLNGNLQTVEELAANSLNKKLDEFRKMKETAPQMYELTLAKMRKARLAQLQLMKNINDFFKDPKNVGQTISVDIMGISRGVINTNPAARTKFSEIDWENSDINVKGQIHTSTVNIKEQGEEKGRSYLRVSGSHSIELDRNALDQEAIDVAMDLIFNGDLKIQRDRRTPKVSADDRIKYFETMFYASKKNGLSISKSPKKDGGYYVTFKGQVMVVNGEEKMPGARQLVQAHLTELYPGGDMRRVHGRFNVANKDKVPVSTVKDGVLSVEEISIEEYADRYTTMMLKPNEGNAVTFLNGYFGFDVSPAEQQKINRAKQEQLKTKKEEKKSSRVEVVDRYSDEDVKNNPDKIYVFGDNTERKGKKGQAQIRDNENAFGIATKFKPSTTKDSYFTDEHFDSPEQIPQQWIDADIAAIKADGRPVVFPKDGLGTGLAKLKEKSPKTYAYLKQRLQEEFGFDNDTGKVSKVTVPKTVQDKVNEILNNKTFIKGYNSKTKKTVELDSGEDYDMYVNTKNGKKYQRVTSFISKEKPEENELLKSSQIIGTEIDTLVRDFFSGNLKPLGEYKFASQDQIKNYVKYLEELQKQFEANGEIPLAEDVVLYDDEAGVAGTTDIVTYTADGEFRIYDMKSMRGNNFTQHYSNDPVNKYETTKYGMSKKEKHAKQLSVYNMLLNNTHGVNAIELKVIPIEIMYNAGDVTTSRLKPHPNLDVQMMDEVEGLMVKEREEAIKSPKSDMDPSKVTQVNDPKPGEGMSPQDLLDIDSDDLYSAKDKNKMASDKRQIERARKWYESSPLAKLVPFNEMFNIVNSNAWAEFTGSAINLYAGADYTVLYHEAFHAFTQLILSKQEKKTLYNKVANTKEGKKAIKEWADKKGLTVDQLPIHHKYLAVEELLAEDFRQYMLSGGKKIMGQSKAEKKNIFQKIADILRALFDKLTGKELGMNTLSPELETIYNNLRIGNINASKASANNNMFTKSAMYSAKPVKGQTLDISKQDQLILVNSLDGLTSEYIDMVNEKLGNSKFTTALFNDPDRWMKNVYQYALNAFVAKEKELRETAELLEDSGEKTFILKNADVLKNAIDNFGDYETGIFAYFIKKSPFLKDQLKTLDNDAFNVTQEDIEAVRFDKKGDELSMMDLASNQVAYTVKSLKRRKSNGEQHTNRFGFPELVNFKQTWQKLISLLRDNNESPSTIYQALEEKLGEEPWIRDLLSKLGEVNTPDNSTFDLWTGFWSAFFTSNQPHFQVLIEEQENNSFKIMIGQAAGVIKQVQRDFSSFFKRSNNPSKYIISTDKGNQLDYKVLDDFKDNIEGNEYAFLTAIGLPITQTEKIVGGLKNVNVQHIYIKLDTLRKGNYPITDIVKALNESITVTIEGKQFRTAKESTNLKKILELEGKYSGFYSNSRVSTPINTTAYEDSQPSSISRMVDAINKAESFQELIGMDFMKHLNVNNHSYILASNLMASLFEPLKNSKGKVIGFGDKIKGAKLQIHNLSGTQSSADGRTDLDFSTTTAGADVYTRLLQDIYQTMIEGKGAGMTPADKGTILSVSVSNLKTEFADSKGNLYIDPRLFLPGTELYTDGIEKTFSLLMPYLDAELQRIAKVKAGNVPAIPGVTIPDSKGNMRGDKLTLFEGVFTNKTKAAILDAGSVDAIPDGVIDDMIAEMDKYFEFSTDQTQATLGDMAYFSSELKDLVTDPNNKNKHNETVKNRTIFKAYTVNKFIHNAEQFAVFYGDPSQYKDFDKRNPALNSTGTMGRTDAVALSFVNEMGKPFQKKHTGESQAASTKLQTAVFQEKVVDSASIPHFKDVLPDLFKERFKALGLKGKDLQNAIDANIERVTSEYFGMEEGDAQGWISFDSYRIISKLMDKWTNDHERLFNKILEDPSSVTLEDVMEYFPPRKYQYFGPLEAEGFGAHAFHKYSLAPLIPGVIKGRNAEKLHNMMMENNIDYALFNTGSKVSTIVNKELGKQDQLYKDDSRELVDNIEFTPNVIHLEFLKEQLDINTHFKGKVIFSTQLRKLIEEGLIEGGVPTDFMQNKSFDKRIEEWEKLDTEEKKREASPFYTRYKDYENLIYNTVEFKKAELKRELGLEEGVTGKGLTKLVDFIKTELDRRDVAEHNIDFIKVDNDGNLVNDLSVSLNASSIERALNAIVNNRLVRIKVNGEPLVQTSGAIFENATEEQKREFTTNDLQFYNYSEQGVRAMDVKVSLQGQFEKLKDLKHKDGRPVGVYDKITVTQAGEETVRRVLNQEKTIARLNETIQDPEWRANRANLDLITMVGVRIPVQGLNSMEFMTVWEFLPSTAGNIIIPPSEIVAKSGSDFDIDKLTVMMPNITMVGNQPEVIMNDGTTDHYGNLDRISEIKKEIRALKKERKEVRDIYYKDGNNKRNQEQDQLNFFLDSIEARMEQMGDPEKLDRDDQIIYNELADTYDNAFDRLELVEKLVDISKELKAEIDSIDDQINSLTRELNGKGTKSYENSMMFSIRDILSMPENFISLITPIDTSIVKPMADKMAKNRSYRADVGAHDEANKKYEQERKDKKEGKDKKPHVEFTRNLEPAYNMYKHESNAVGKDTLGQGAVDNTFNVILNRVGAYLNDEFKVGKATYQSRLLLEHNTTNRDGKKDLISMSHLYDINNENKIADVINQLINGWVDVAKDAWIFDIQGNKEITPTLLFMIQAGVPFETTVNFLSNPLVKEYASEQKKFRSAFAKAAQRKGAKKVDTSYKRNAKIKMFDNLGYSGLYDYNSYGTAFIKSAEFSQFTKKRTDIILKSDPKAMDNSAEKVAGMSYIDARGDETARAMFLHFLEIEMMADQMSSLKTTLNYDTSKSATLYQAQEVDVKVNNLRKSGLFPNKVIDGVLEDSVIGAFKINDFQLNIWNKLFKIRNSELVNDKIREMLNDQTVIRSVNKLFGDGETFVEQFKNDIVVQMYTNVIRNKDFTEGAYRGIEIVNVSDKVKNGAEYQITKGGVKLIVNTELLKRQYEERMFMDKKDSPYIKAGLAPTGPAFANETGETDYMMFVFEREYQRFMNPLSKMKDTEYFKFRRAKYPVIIQAKNGVSAEDRNKKADQYVYEQIIKDAALNKTLNTYKLFKSNQSTADEFFEITKMHPELLDNYNVVQDLILNKSSEGDFKNLQLRDNRATVDQIEVYYSNLLELADVNTLQINTDNEIEKQRVADFFKMFPHVGFLQSGLDFKGNLALGSILPQQDILSILAEAEPITSAFLESFEANFMNHNSNRRTRFRWKEYSGTGYYSPAMTALSDMEFSERPDEISGDDYPCNGGLPI